MKMINTQRIHAVLVALLVSLFLGGECFAQQAEKPEPIVIKRGREKLVIPKVERDQVICFALYTVEKGVLKLSAQLYPLRESESRTVTLEVRDGGSWKAIAKGEVEESHWMHTFRVENWDHSRRTSPIA